MAAVPRLRRSLLHLPAVARSQGRGRLGDPNRAAPALLHRPHRYDPDRRPGAHPSMVADGLFPGVQIAARGQDAYFPVRASRSRRSLSCPRRRRSTSSRCRTRRPPSASCSRGASIRAAARYPPRRNGRQPRTRFSTARIGIFLALRAKRLNGSADRIRSPQPVARYKAGARISSRTPGVDCSSVESGSCRRGR